MFKIDLSKHPNPYSYLFRGSQMNMMNWILRERKKAKRLQEYQNELYKSTEEEYAGMQNTDPTWGNDK